MDKPKPASQGGFWADVRVARRRDEAAFEHLIGLRTAPSIGWAPEVVEQALLEFSSWIMKS